MGEDVPKVSVVIPTIGRPSLATAMSAAFLQTLPPYEVIVVNDSTEQAELVGEGDDHLVVELMTGGRKGPSVARNLGMTAARGEYIALLDDDDEWLEDHLHQGICRLQARPEEDIYSCRALLVRGNDRSITPKVRYRGSVQLIDFLYGKRIWIGRHRTLPLPTFIMRRDAASIQMDPDLNVKEDVWWLLQQERSGRKIHQAKHVGVIWNRSHQRTADRHSAPVDIEWARRLNALQPRAGSRYMRAVVCRNLARKGDVEQLRSLEEGVAASWREPISYVPVRWAERFLARIRSSSPSLVAGPE